MPDQHPGWTVLIPLKPSALGKSRLSVPGIERQNLTQAIALDTVEAACSCQLVGDVVIVSSDDSWTLPSGARLVVEPRTTTIDDAVAFALRTVSVRLPRAVLLGDVSGLRPHDLAEALCAAANFDRGLVTDYEGTGTTLVTARPGVDFATAFGVASADRHRRLGFVDLPIGASSTLRRDVDIVEHLSLAVGPRTSSLIYAEGSRVLAGVNHD
jgi:2-phospho-L-lactate/phosphoenolpyruvate guanylyltransferase